MIPLENDVFLRLNSNDSTLIVDKDYKLVYVHTSDTEETFTPLNIYVSENTSLRLFSTVNSKVENKIDISIFLKEHSFCKVFLLNLGQSLSIDIKTELLGEKASVDIKTIYILPRAENLNLNVFQRHIAPFSKSNLVVKGVLKDKAKSSFKGIINVGEEAEMVSAYQINRTLILEDGPVVESIPILEIENDKVERCSHGSTIGRINEEELFYLETRGINRKNAVNILSIAFLQDLLDEFFTEVSFLKNSITKEVEDILRS